MLKVPLLNFLSEPSVSSKTLREVVALFCDGVGIVTTSDLIVFSAAAVVSLLCGVNA